MSRKENKKPGLGKGEKKAHHKRRTPAADAPPGKRRLLIATDAYLPRWDGIARYLAEIIPRIKDDFSIRVIAPHFRGYDAPASTKDFEVVPVPTYGFTFGDFHPPSFQYSIIKKEVAEADLVWTHAIMPIGMCAIYAARKAKVPVIATIHSLEWELAQNSLSPRTLIRGMARCVAQIVAKHFYNKVDLIIVSDKEVAEKLQRVGINTEKVAVPLATDTKKFSPPKSKRQAKEKLGLDPEKLFIGYAGRVGREKDIMTLVKAFRRIRAERSDVGLLIIGDGVKEQVDVFRAEKGINYFSNQDDIVPFLQAMDIYVLPSLTETSSLSTMEAMSCGVPVVTTKVGHVKRYVRERVSGLFFPKQNYLVLSLKLSWLLKNDSARESMGQMARVDIADNFSWDRTGEETMRILKDF
ncbi:MAG: glycosyltransferase family 4 protein [archaeon]